MKRFIKKVFLYVILIYLANLVIGKTLEIDFIKKTEQKCFYPPHRWNEFYSIQNHSIDAVFLGSSHSYRGYNPAIFDSITSLSSFNMGSSIQTISTSYYILLEVLNHHVPQFIFLDVFPFTINSKQLEAVRYNLPYIRSINSRNRLFINGLTFKEKIEYIFPAYSRRSSIFSTIRFLFFPHYKIETDELYLDRGFVTSINSLKTTNTSGSNLNPWNQTDMTPRHMEHLQFIADICKLKGIELIITRTPTANKVYSNLYDFDKKILSFTKQNNIKYINFDSYANEYLNYHDYKDIGHLNINGSTKLTIKFAKYVNNLLDNNSIN